jgi:hypothetical protein
MSNDTPSQGSTAAPAGFWQRLWQRIRNWSKRQESSCCDATTRSAPNASADNTAQGQKAAA